MKKYTIVMGAKINFNENLSFIKSQIFVQAYRTTLLKE